MLKKKNNGKFILMMEIFLALLSGTVVGLIFSALKLPLPAPPVLSGVIGVLGVYLGGIVYEWIIKMFFS